MNNNEITDLILLGRETERLEYRGSQSWSDAKTQASLVKSVLAMSHVRSGGVIVLGVEPEAGKETFKAAGMKPEHLKTFDQEKVQNFVNGYSDATIKLSLHEIKLENSEFLAIVVPEFKGKPILCRQDGPEGILRGNLYWRTPGTGEIQVIERAFPFRAMFDRGIEKEVLSFWTRMQNLAKQRKGSTELDPNKITEIISSERPIENLPAEDAKRYEKELDSLSEPQMLFDRIISTGFWTLELRPFGYEPKRIEDNEKLKELLEDSVVAFRGSGFPAYTKKTLEEFHDGIGSETDFMSLIYRWRFFNSGLFVYYTCCREDHEIDIEHLEDYNINPSYPSNTYLDVVSTLYVFVELFEFASRLAFRDVFPNGLEMSITLANAEDRQLFFWDPVWGFNDVCVSKAPRIQWKQNYGEHELFKNSQELCLEACYDFFKSFHSQAISRETLEMKQKECLKLLG